MSPVEQTERNAMHTTFVRATTLSAIALVMASSTAMAQPAIRLGGGAPPVPTGIEAPAGATMFFKAHAIGTQNYVCLPAATGVAWKFVAPQATLFETFFGSLTQQLATHFLSPNPDENALPPRATWQHSLDSSRVWARVMNPAINSSIDPSYVEAGAIPWLLLTVVGAEAGPEGGAFLTHAAFIQRVNTSGGVAPAAGCSQPVEVGAVTLVPYTADYLFYRAPRAR